MYLSSRKAPCLSTFGFSLSADDVFRLQMDDETLPPVAPHHLERKSSDAETVTGPSAKPLGDQVIGDTVTSSETLRSPRITPKSSCILGKA